MSEYARSGQQSDWLRQQGLPFKQDGSRIIVSRVHIRSWIEGQPVLARGGINLAAIR